MNCKLITKLKVTLLLVAIMGVAIEQYRARVGSHANFLKRKEIEVILKMNFGINANVILYECILFTKVKMVGVTV